MTIKYLGHASFFIRTKDAKVVTDPYDPQMTGMKFPKVEADIVTVSHHHQDHDRVHLVSGAPLVLDWPGEYEKNAVRVFGFKSYHDTENGKSRGENILYKIEAEGVSVLHCGDMGVVPDDELVDEIGEVDILLIPVGGFYTIDANGALEAIKHLEPSIVIPMHYNHEKLNPKVFERLAPLTDFLKKYGAESAEPVDQLQVKKEDLADAETKVVVLKMSN
ncbi:MBL fold metallo-hydrolase [Candidatus Roizmanbacteria bacterium]|nr:MBL fold metallo-hydrolase [Candidatus Roizmanbacteria bacterium]